MYSVQFSSVAQSCLTLCDSPDCSTPGLPVHHQLLEFTQTHVHWVGEAIQPSHPLLSLLLPPSVFPSIRVFYNELAPLIRWPKYWSFGFSIRLPDLCNCGVALVADGVLERRVSGKRRNPHAWSVLSGSGSPGWPPSGTEDAQLFDITPEPAVSASVIPAHAAVVSACPSASSGPDMLSLAAVLVVGTFCVASGTSAYCLNHHTSETESLHSCVFWWKTRQVELSPHPLPYVMGWLSCLPALFLSRVRLFVTP